MSLTRPQASQISYESPDVGFTETDVQGALDSLIAKVKMLEGLGGGILILPYASSLNWDLETSFMFKTTLTGSVTLNIPSNIRAGSWIMYVVQDNVGGRQMTFDAAYLGPRGLLPVLSTLPNAVDILSFVSDGVTVAVSIQANLATA